MSDRNEQRRLRRKLQKQARESALATTRSWELFGEAMRFVHAHAPPGSDVFNELRFGGDAQGSWLQRFCALFPGIEASDIPLIERFRYGFSSLFFVEERNVTFLRLTDLATGRSHEVVAARAELIGRIEAKHFAATLLVPVPDGWMLGGMMRGVKDGVSDTQIRQVARRIALAEPDRVRAANPKITDAMLHDLHQGFSAHFGADHFVCSPHLLGEKLQDFHDSWVPPEREGYVSCGRLETEVDLDNARQIGLIADPVWGYVVVEDLDQLLLAARTGDHQRLRRWLEDGSHPAAFRCAWRNHPEETEAALKTLLGTDDWATKTENKLKLHKPGFFPPRPSLVPLPADMAGAPADSGPPAADGIGLAALLVG